MAGQDFLVPLTSPGTTLSIFWLEIFPGDVRRLSGTALVIGQPFVFIVKCTIGCCKPIERQEGLDHILDALCGPDLSWFQCCDKRHSVAQVPLVGVCYGRGSWQETVLRKWWWECNPHYQEHTNPMQWLDLSPSPYRLQYHWDSVEYQDDFQPKIHWSKNPLFDIWKL